MLKEKIQCDICERAIYLTPKAKYDLEREGWSVYCSACADKTGYSKYNAILSQIKIYKIQK